MDTWSDKQLAMMEVPQIISCFLFVHAYIMFVYFSSTFSSSITYLTHVQAGCNGTVKEFFRKHGVPDGVGIREKYNTRAAQLFKERVLAQVEVN